MGPPSRPEAQLSRFEATATANIANTTCAASSSTALPVAAFHVEEFRPICRNATAASRHPTPGCSTPPIFCRSGPVGADGDFMVSDATSPMPNAARADAVAKAAMLMSSRGHMATHLNGFGNTGCLDAVIGPHRPSSSARALRLHFAQGFEGPIVSEESSGALPGSH